MRYLRVLTGMALTLSVIFAPSRTAIALELDHQLRSKIVKKVSAFASSIGCDVGRVRADMIIDLLPNGHVLDKRIAVFWDGDQECARGSGSAGTNVAIVEFSPIGEVYVTPSVSHSRFERNAPRYIHRISAMDEKWVKVIGSDDCRDERSCAGRSETYLLARRKLGRWE